VRRPGATRLWMAGGLPSLCPGPGASSNSLTITAGRGQQGVCQPELPCWPGRSAALVALAGSSAGCSTPGKGQRRTRPAARPHPRSGCGEKNSFGREPSSRSAPAARSCSRDLAGVSGGIRLAGFGPRRRRRCRRTPTHRRRQWRSESRRRDGSEGQIGALGAIEGVETHPPPR